MLAPHDGSSKRKKDVGSVAVGGARLRAWGAPQAIREFSKVGKPIYITETGIADAKDTLRAEWAESYFRAVGLDPEGESRSSTCAAMRKGLGC